MQFKEVTLEVSLMFQIMQKHIQPVSLDFVDTIALSSISAQCHYVGMWPIKDRSVALLLSSIRLQL